MRVRSPWLIEQPSQNARGEITNPIKTRGVMTEGRREFYQMSKVNSLRGTNLIVTEIYIGTSLFYLDIAYLSTAGEY